jgi:ubiquinol-cytochrome c reductase iron-sulfur subunit
MSKRRDFLRYATGSTGAVAIGDAGFGLSKSCTPDATQQVTKWLAKFDLKSLSPGLQVMVPVSNQPVFILKLTDAQTLQAQSVEISALRDPYVQNANLSDAAPATLENRTANFGGPIVIQVGLCTHLGCVPLNVTDQQRTWSCPCHAAHFDNLGRVLAGPAPTNMSIPRYRVSDDGIVSFLGSGQGRIDEETLDHLIYQKPPSGT